jgi:hypothetical protein
MNLSLDIRDGIIDCRLNLLTDSVKGILSSPDFVYDVCLKEGRNVTVKKERTKVLMSSLNRMTFLRGNKIVISGQRGRKSRMTQELMRRTSIPSKAVKKKLLSI